MRKSSKKSTVKSKSKKRKNPLKKYQTAGAVTPTVGATGAAPGGFGSGILKPSGFDSATLGSDSYLSSPTSTTNTYNSQFGDSFSSPYGSDFSSTPNSSYSGLDAGLNTEPIKPRTLTEFNVDENTNLSQTARNQANIMNAEYKADPLKVSRKMQDDDIARGVLATMPAVGSIAAATKRTSIDDPNRYYSRRAKGKLESYNKKINASAAMSNVGQGIMGAGTSLIGAIGPWAAIPIAVGAIWTAASEGAKASYEGDQKEFGAEYDQRVADRQKTERRAKAQREKNEEMNQQQYFQQAPGPNAGISIGRDGGMMKYQVGGLKREAPLEEEVDVMNPAMDVLMNGGFSDKQKSALRTIEQKYGPEIRDRVIMADRISKTGGNTAGTPVQNSRYVSRPGPIASIPMITPQMKANADLVRQQKGMSTPHPIPAQPIQKYMAGGYQKVTGPSHEDGGVAMDLDADGVVDSELEGGEIIEEMKHGGNASKKYIWSDHLKTGGISFAKKFEQERKRGATPRRIEKLRVEQELAAKRDPSKLYAKYGGMHKYQKGGYRKEDLTKRDEEAIQKYLDSSTAKSMERFGMAARNRDSLRLMNRFSNTESFYNPYNKEFYQKENVNLGKPPTPLSEMKSGGMMKYQTGGQRVSRTGAGKFFAEYGAPLANVAGEAVNIGMNLSQEYNPVETTSAPDVKAEKVFIDRAKDLRVGARESELINAKRSLQMSTGPKNAALNSARMVSLRAQEEAAQNVYDQNRQASTKEQQRNQAAQLKAAMTNQDNARLESESRRNEGLRKESFENLRKKYIGSVAGELGNQLAQGMYTKEYINATLPEGVDPYELRPGAIANKQQETNPATGELYTLADARNEVLMQLQKERLAKAAKKAARKKKRKS